MDKIVTIVFAEDQKMFREIMVSEFKKENIITIGEASNGIELLEILEKDNIRPDIVILDIFMHGMNGKEALRAIKKKFPEQKVIILSGYSDGAVVNDFIANGASSYITKDSSFQTMVQTIRNTKFYMNYSNITEKLQSMFTDGELDIIPYILSGKTNKDIALTLSKSIKTIEKYRDRMYTKTGSKNVADFSKFCTNIGLEFVGDSESGNLG